MAAACRCRQVIEMLYRSPGIQLGKVVGLTVSGVYLTLVCLAATCLLMHGSPSAEHAQVGQHAHPRNQPLSSQDASLCVWACQAGASPALTVEPTRAPTLAAMVVSPSPMPQGPSSVVSSPILTRGPPL